VTARPGDKDAKAKYAECNKIVRKIAFEKAIAVDDNKKSVSESIDVDAISKLLVFHLRLNFNVSMMILQSGV